MTQLDGTQLQRFRDEGYLLLPRVFSDEEVGILKAEAQRIFGMHRAEVWREAKSDAVRAAFAANRYSPVYQNLSRHPRVLDPARQLLGDEVYMHQFKINAKEAFVGEGFIWHQDYGSWHRDDGMPEPRALNVAVFLDEVSNLNGPLWLIPGSHKLGIIAAEHDSASSSFALWQPDKTVIRELAERNGIVTAEGSAGSMLMFDCQILHASPANLSPWPRNIVYFTANAVSNAARAFRREEFIAMRDFTPLEPLADDCLLRSEG